MTDLYDNARSVRDAALAEVLRLTGGADFDPNARAANILGVHVTAVMMAFTADRHLKASGQGGFVHDESLQEVIAAGIATAVANAAMAYRPLGPNLKPLPPQQVALQFLSMICDHTMRQVVTNESGLQDYVVPLHRNADGVLEPKPFDLETLLKGKP